MNYIIQKSKISKLKLIRITFITRISVCGNFGRSSFRHLDTLASNHYLAGQSEVEL